MVGTGQRRKHPGETDAASFQVVTRGFNFERQTVSDEMMDDTRRGKGEV